MKKILSLLVGLMLCTQLPAQDKKECKTARETLRQKKEAFMKQEAQLTDEEAAQFFPLYFELHKRQNQLKKNIWKGMHNEKEQELNEKDYEAMLHQMSEANNLSHELDQLYLEKYKAFLSAKKIYRLMKADILFNRRLLKIHSYHRGRQTDHP